MSGTEERFYIIHTESSVCMSQSTELKVRGPLSKASCDELIQKAGWDIMILVPEKKFQRICWKLVMHV